MRDASHQVNCGETFGLKLGAQLKVSVRRIRISFANACPYQDVFCHAWQTLHHYPLRC